jgi:abequosyltransferase
MMNQIKLSICIPTYNREPYLRELLDSLVPQMKGRENIEIVISDNASIDNTGGMVEQFRDSLPNIRYHRWDSNVGADRNYLKVIELAEGEYCWYMGSDDWANENSVQVILEEIEGSDVDILLFDRIEVVGGNRRKRNYWLETRRDFAFHSGKQRNDFFGYLEKCISPGGLFSYLSVIVLRRARWDRIRGFERFIGGGYVHTYILLSILNEGATFRFLCRPIVSCRIGMDSFNSDPADPELTYRRWKMDIDGYRDISITVFGSDAYETYLINRMMDRYLPAASLVSLQSLMDAPRKRNEPSKIQCLLWNSGLFRKYSVVRIANATVVRLAKTVLSPFRR